MRVGIDLHGLIVDHRKAKHAFFRDVMDCEYSDPILDRAQILMELDQRGFGRKFYFDGFAKFVQSEYYAGSELVDGVIDFLRMLPADLDVYVISTAVYNSVSSVSRTLDRLGVKKICGILALTDEQRASALSSAGIGLYFDDKSDLLGSIGEMGIATVQVCPWGYSKVTNIADFYFSSWSEARRDLRAILEYSRGIEETRSGAQRVAPADAGAAHQRG